MKQIIITLILSLFLISCSNQILPEEVVDIKKSLKLQISTDSERAIEVQEYRVTKLEIEITGTYDKSITWEPTDDKEINIQLSVGSYEILIKHISEKDGITFIFEETSSFQIRPSVITVIKITPGAVGFIEIDTEAVVTEPVIEELTDLEKIQESFIGNWVGTVTTPWIDPYSVEVEFKSNGTYSARNTSSNGPAFYYGSDDDSESKTYQIYDLYANGQAIANITLYFWPGNVNYSKLDFIELSDNNNKLVFEYWHRSEYGPVTFELTRVLE